MAPQDTFQDRPENKLGDDILEGVSGIASWWFGDATALNKKKISNHIDKRGLPIFRVGRCIFARKSVLLAWIKEQEDRAQAPGRAA